VLASYTVADLLEEVLNKHPLAQTSAR